MVFRLAMHPAGWPDPCTAQLQDSRCAVGWINDPSQAFSHCPPAYPWWVHIGIVPQLSFEEARPLLLLFWGRKPSWSDGCKGGSPQPPEGCFACAPAQRLLPLTVTTFTRGFCTSAGACKTLGVYVACPIMAQSKWHLAGAFKLLKAVWSLLVWVSQRGPRVFLVTGLQDSKLPPGSKTQN